MVENKEELRVLKQDIQKLKALLKKSEASADKNREKIRVLQSEIDETDKEIARIKSELTEKESTLKKYDYSSALRKLDNAALSKLSKRQAEQLAEYILSGTISSLLDEEKPDETNISVENGKGE